MALSVSTLQAPVRNNRFLSVGFRNIIEDHLQWLKSSTGTTANAVALNAMIKYKGDFYGYLFSIDVDQDIHWIVMRLNGMHNPIEFGENYPQILLPDQADLDFLLGRYLNVVTTI